MVETIVRVAENTVDELTASEGREVIIMINIINLIKLMNWN